MKTKTILYFLTVLCFSILFYNQGFGLNYLIFGIVLIANSVIMNRTVVKSRQWQIVSLGIIVSSFFTMYYGNDLSITMALISLLIFLTVKTWRKSSIIVALVAGYLSLFATIGFMILGRADAQKLKQLQERYTKAKNSKWLPILAVIAVVTLFTGLYCSINPVFESFINDALNSISWGWPFFTLLGTLLLYTFYFPPRILRKAMRFEESMEETIQPNGLLQPNSFLGKIINYQSEKLAAILMFTVLNLLLLILNCTDINYLFIKSVLPYGLTLADYVHNGVGAVITSIILAILLILFYFRGKLNFDDESKSIKVLTYIWIIQNILLVLMTMFKNDQYINVYALTYKRIGVYFYLLFAIIGLIFTAYKLHARKTSWFLIKCNAMAIYLVLITSCMLNWNAIVTNYNLKNTTTPDYQYLCDLGYDNYPTLWNKEAFNTFPKMDVELNFGKKPQTYYLPEEVANFLKTYENEDLPSYCTSKQNTYEYFAKLAEGGKLDRYMRKVDIKP